MTYSGSGNDDTGREWKPPVLWEVVQCDFRRLWREEEAHRYRGTRDNMADTLEFNDIYQEVKGSMVRIYRDVYVLVGGPMDDWGS